MRIVRFIDDAGDLRLGRRHSDGAVTLFEGDWPGTALRDTGVQADVHKFLAPVEPPAIFCIGLNYRQHAEETGAKIPDFPVIFMKNPAAVNHPGDPILLPACCMNPPEVDYEVELAVVIGRAAKDVPESDALNYVLGYTVGNDVSARTWQKKRAGGQWIKGKGFDTFCPLGPDLVTPGELPDPQNLRLTSVLNGEVMQDGYTGDMIFPVARLIECLSLGTTLLPGTVILTGTPSGVGVAREPQVFLKPGDRLVSRIDGIGELLNPVENA